MANDKLIESLTPGETIILLRRRLRMTGQDVAEMVDLNQGTVSAAEADKAGVLTTIRLLVALRQKYVEIAPEPTQKPVGVWEAELRAKYLDMAINAK